MYKIISPFFLACFILIGGLLNHSLVFAEEETEYRFERLWPRVDESLSFLGISGIEVALDGSFYVVDAASNNITHITAQGEFIRTWGEYGRGDGQFDYPKDIKIAPNGDVYVVDDTNRIQQFTAEGDFIRQWHSAVFSVFSITLNGIAIAANGDIYVTSSGAYGNAVQVFTAEGSFIRQWGGGPEQVGLFYEPNDISVAPNGDVYVLEGSYNLLDYTTKIQQFTAEGSFIREWKSLPGNGGFNGIETGPNGNIYVLISGKIHQLTAEGDLVPQWKNQLSSISNVAFSPNGNIYVNKNSRIQRFTAKGDFIQTIGIRISGSDEGQFYFPSDVAVAPNGDVYVADRENNRVQQLTAKGDFIRQWGTKGKGEGQFNSGGDIAVAPNGTVYVADGNNERIQQFTAKGGFIRQWGKEGEEEGQFDNPGGIAVAPNGNVYVADRLTDRIQQFTAEGGFIRQWSTSSPSDIAIRSNGNIYVVGADKPSIVVVFTPEGDFIQQWELGELGSTSNIAVASNGNFYVTNLTDNSVHEFIEQEGQVIRTIANSGTGDGQFSHPRGIDISTTGDLYIADMRNARIQKFTRTRKNTVASHPYKAIILAGGGKTIGGRPNHIWNGTKRVTRDAYKTLTRQAFKAHEEIKFLTAGNTQDDLDGNGKFDDYEVATKESLRKAIVEWATDAEDVVIFLANHGGAGSFQVNNDEVLVGEELNSWINQLEQTIPGKVSIIIESCNSASFFEYLKKSNRYLFASAKADQPAVISNEGLTSFSYYFWSEVAKGARAKPAFTTARQGMSRIETDKGSQNAQADTDGNGIYNQKDLENLGEYCFGACNQTANQAPNIKPLKTGRQTLTGEITKDFSMTVSHLNPLKQGWALVQRPDDIHIDTSQPLNFEKVYLTCKENNRVESVCSGQYEKFDVKGEYRVNFYAMDTNKDASFPETLIINQTQGKAVAPTQYDDQQAIVYLRDVVVNGKHLQAALKQEGNSFVAFAVNDAVKQYAPAAEFNAVTGKLEIPHAQVFGKTYKATFNYLGGLNFSLESASPQ